MVTTLEDIAKRPLPAVSDDQLTLPGCLSALEVLEIDRHNVVAMAESAGRTARLLGHPRHWNNYPDNGLHEEQREAWFQGYDAGISLDKL